MSHPCLGVLGERWHQRPQPNEVFSVLGNETRMDILCCLWAAEEPLPFSALQEHVDYADSGNFTYHLDQLDGEFIRWTDGGYELRGQGERVMRAVLAGAFSEDVSWGPVELDQACPYCGSEIELQYAEYQLLVRCTSCHGANGVPTEGTLRQLPFPPANLTGCSAGELLERARVLSSTEFAAMAARTCPKCGGTVTAELDVCPEHDTQDGRCPVCESRYSAWTTYRCAYCEYSQRYMAWWLILVQPVFAVFYHEHTQREQPSPLAELAWEVASHSAPIREHVRSTHPLRLEIGVPVETAVLYATLDDEPEIIDIEW